ncbi:MAG TPA: ATP-binding cassette domain-containing protein, partial [Alphaproteobacteria bacterium]
DQRDRLLRRFGVLFQNGALFDSLPVWHNIAFSPMSREGLAREAAKDLARARLAAVNLPPATADLYPAELSGGMQKRVALARAIAGRPDILLLDDPTAGLDPILTTLIDQLILRSLDDLKATAITITHDLASVRRIADRVALLADGRIVWEGSVGELERAGHPAVARFIRGSRAA